MNNVLITGITGQDGAYLAKLLLDNNYQVYGVIRNNNIYDHNLKSLDVIDEVKFLPLDFSHGEEFADILCQYRIDEVYHLAAQSSVGYSFSNPHQTIKENFNLTANLLEQVRLSKRNIKFYNSVSSEIFGNQDILPITEQSIINPVSPYGLSKGAGVHDKTNKAKRQKLKRMLQKELREPPTYLGGFLFNTHILVGFIYPYYMYNC